MSEPAPDLLKYLDGLVDVLRRKSPLAIGNGETSAIHDSRVATRRLKAALELFEPLVHPKHIKPFAKIGKTLRRRLGPLRDADVMMEHLRALNSPRHQSAIAWIAGRLAQSREADLKKLQAALSTEDALARLGAWWGLHAQFTSVVGTVDSLLNQSIHLQLDRFAEQAVVLTQWHRSETAASQQPRQDPHQLRIAGKALRYTLEMAKANGRPLPKQLLARFKSMQEHLGLWHDYVVLTERLLSESIAALLAHHDGPLQGNVLTLAMLTLKRSTQHLDRLLSYWDRHGQTIINQIRSLFPLITTARPVELSPATPQADAAKEASIAT